MKIFRMILYIFMMILGLVVVYFVNGICFYRTHKTIEEVTIKLIDANVVDEKYNNKYVMLADKVSGIVMDTDFYISTNALGLERVVRKWDGSNWNLVENNQEKYYTKIFNSLSIKVGRYTLINYQNEENFNKLRYGNNNGNMNHIDLKDIVLPDNYKIIKNELPFSVPLIENDNISFYITNSANVSNPANGDIVIYYHPLFPLGHEEIIIEGEIINNNEIDLSKDTYYRFVDNGITLTKSELLKSYDYYKTVYIYIALIISIIGFMIICFSVHKFLSIKNKYSEIRKYEIVIISIIFGLIVPFLLYTFT